MQGITDLILDSIFSLDFWLKYSIMSTNFIIILAIIFNKKTKIPTDEEKKNVLLVIAHPDDEAMFFVPVIKDLAPKSNMKLLCLSNGNFDGIGKIREKELDASCKFLNIQGCTTIDHPELQDGMKSNWNANIINDILHEHLTARKTDAVITFGPNGVSGHPNHRAIHTAVKLYIESENGKAYIQEKKTMFYELIDTNIFRKYMGIFDLPISALQNYSYINLNPFYTYKSMKVHTSQFVWFRRLFVFLARYSYSNTFKPMN